MYVWMYGCMCGHGWRDGWWVVQLAGLATVERVGFGGQTAPTTRFGNRNCTNYHILKTNYPPISATDSGAVVMKDKISLKGGGQYIKC